MMTLPAQADQNNSADEKAIYFTGMKGCFLLYNLKTGIFEKEIGGDHCQERFVACSTFKVPLSVMAFDAGLLANEDEILKWDGKIEAREVVNRDHNARGWMKDSVVWFSKRLTPQLGKERFEKYLKDFNYGNQDLSGGITEAWLIAPGTREPALKISAYEQVDFMKRLWKDDFPVSKRAMQITRELMYLETLSNGFKLSGKTGSNFYDDKKRLGWFIAHLENGDREYIAVTVFSDSALPVDNAYGGAKAKEITKKIFETF
jgi:beta-lactamase class D